MQVAITQLWPRQTSPDPQAWPQVPQFWVSESGSTQWSPQHWNGGPQVVASQLPPMGPASGSGQLGQMQSAMQLCGRGTSSQPCSQVKGEGGQPGTAQVPPAQSSELAQSSSEAQGWPWQLPPGQFPCGWQVPPLLVEGNSVPGEPGHGVTSRAQSKPGGQVWSSTEQVPPPSGTSQLSQMHCVSQLCGGV